MTSQQISKIEPLPVPTERTPTPSLPAWLTSRESVLVRNDQIDQMTGKWIEPWTLPPAAMPTDEHRAAIEEHLRSLRSLLQNTPQNSDAALATLTASILKLMLAKPTRAGGAEAAEARAEAYEAALEDLPPCAVIAAIRKWYRGECGKDAAGEAHDYRWAPDSAVLRMLAQREIYPVIGRIHLLEQLLEAVPFVDCSARMARGRAAVRGLMLTIKTPDKLEGLTFEKAVQIGEQRPDAEPARPAAEAAE